MRLSLSLDCFVVSLVAFVSRLASSFESAHEQMWYCSSKRRVDVVQAHGLFLPHKGTRNYTGMTHTHEVQ